MWKLACLQLSFKSVKAGIETGNIWLSWVVRYQVDEVKIVIKPLCIPHLVQIAPQYPPRDRWAGTERGAFPRIDPRINSNPPQFPHSTTSRPAILLTICHPGSYMRFHTLKRRKVCCVIQFCLDGFPPPPTWLVLTVLTEDQAVNSRSRVWDISLPFQPMPCWALFPSHILSHPTITAINQYYLTISTDTMWSKAILSQSQGSKLIKYWTLFLVFWAEDISFTSLHPFLSGGGSESFCHKYKRPSQPACTLSRQPAWHSNWGNYPQTSYPLMHPRRYRLAFNAGYLSQLLGKHSIDISPQTTFKFFAFLSQTKQWGFIQRSKDNQTRLPY